jgi:transcription factor E
MKGLNSVEDGVLSEVLGSEGAEIVKVIDSPMEDKAISEKLDYETSTVRSVLNELLVKNLVQLNRKKYDTGYTNYSWVRREDKIIEYIDMYMDKRIRKLHNMLSGPDEIVFECGCSRVGYEAAIDALFTCPDCGRGYRQVNAGKGSRKIRSELKRLKSLRRAS